MKPTDAPRSGAVEPAPDAPSEKSRRLIVVNQYPIREVIRATTTLLGVLVGAYLLWLLSNVILLVLLAILVATAIEPMVNALRRGRFDRGGGVLVVYTTIIVALGAPSIFLAPSLLSQVGAFAEALPSRVDELRPYSEQVGPRPLRDLLVRGVDNLGEAVRNPELARADEILTLGTSALRATVDAFSVFVMAYYWLVERATIKRALLRAVPARRARRVNLVWLEVEQKLGGWVRGQLLVMLCTGTIAGTGFFLLGLPNPVVLALAVALGELIPLVGPFFGFLPAVLTALVTNPLLTLPVVLFAVAVQQFEGNILVPRVMGRAVGISPLTVMIGILVGVTLDGLMGAFLAVPVAAALQVVVAHALGVDADAPAHPRPHPASARGKHRAGSLPPEPALIEAAASAPETR